MNRLSVAGLVIAVPALALLVGCPPPKPPEPEKPVVEEVAPVADVASDLALSSVTPDNGVAGKAVEVSLLGSGFEPGATVRFGSFDATAVSVTDESLATAGVPASLPAGTWDVVLTNPGGESATLRRGFTVRAAEPEVVCDFVRVHFDFDSDALTTESKAALDDKLECLAEVDGRVRIEGHTDARGTVDYNLALGERRAESVRTFLERSGSTGAGLRTVSYGEERPVEAAATEQAWATNRRADLVVER